MQCRLVYFFGPDGTGKTTQAELIFSYLRRNGVLTMRGRVKQHHTLSYLLLKLLRPNNKDYLKTNFFGFDTQLNSRIRRPWEILEIISVIPAIAYRVALPSLLGYTVVCDRYVIDTVVVLSRFLDDQGFMFGNTARLLMKLIPKQALLIHLDADTETILARKKDEPLTQQLVNQYRASYKNIIHAFRLRVVTIDTTNISVLNVQETVQNLLEFDKCQ
jgi:thymidylate kinase